MNKTRVMKHLIEQLKRFNAKERFWLIAHATGSPGLSPTFRSQLTDAVGAPVPSDAWWAMDYHLDWLEAALECAGADRATCFPQPEPSRNLNRNQEDVDLIVAWDDGDLTRLSVVEAKGATSWATEQYGSKLRRLTFLFGSDGETRAGLSPSFVLASPRRPTRLAASDPPVWSCLADGRPRWLPLPMPEDLERPERCDERGASNAAGNYWHVVPRPIAPEANKG